MFWTPEQEAILHNLNKEKVTHREIASRLGRTIHSIRRKLKAGKESVAGVKENLEVDVKEDVAVITSHSKTVRTLEQALKASAVDTKVWEVERFVINKWDCVAKIEPKNSKKKVLAATELWQVKVFLRRKVPVTIEEGLKLFLAQVPAAKTDRIFYEKHADPYLLEVSIWDHHFGKLAWGRETGENYDLKIAEQIYSDAAHELIEKSRGFNIDKIVLPIGQDFFHVDGPNNTTTAGTPQDVDGRLAKIFATGQRALINLCDLLMGIAPVHILWVPGNHDWYTSWYLIKVLEAHYRHTRTVTVDASEMPRKHIEYGVNLLGYTHGCDEKHGSLPAIMAGQWPHEWARTTHREWKLGHFHRVKETHYNAAETIDGVLVRVLPSLCGTDSWHFKKGYVGGMRAAQAFLYSAKRGYAAHLNAMVKNGN